ncbi:hypothetical protein [Streptomyces sp. NPDC094466]|uniref:hypothetical protein n=1 Tax=Streptomyces sp. NPDC094466 TaxID=3366065 RepID=UPI00380758F6
MDSQDQISPVACQSETGSNCAGFQVMGGSRFQEKTNQVAELRFNIYSFDTLENAQVAMKGYAAEGRAKAGAGAEPVKVETGADDVKAFAGDEERVVALRVGAVLAQIRGINVDKNVVDNGAKMQAERIKKAADGKNPTPEQATLSGPGRGRARRRGLGLSPGAGLLRGGGPDRGGPASGARPRARSGQDRHG